MNRRKPTLVILAAGIGSRYGGLKQLDTFTPDGATIMDFSIYDAIQAGFGNVVFIIRKNIEKEFKQTFNAKLEGKITVDYVFQEIEYIPKKYQNTNRKKPWGTGHALLMAKDIIKENFAIINADDFYGKEAFKIMATTLLNTDKASYDFNMISYLLKNTLSENGFVSRGECQVNKEDYLTTIIERTHIEKKDGQLLRKDENENFIPIDNYTIVSMNFWGFTPKCFEFIDPIFEEFLEKNNSNLKAEFFIPLIGHDMIQSNTASVKVLHSDAKWFGVTYKEDKKMVQQAITQLIHQKKYPSKLW
jgi:choline kinase